MQYLLQTYLLQIQVLFENNSGFQGGAVALFGLSVIFVQQNSIFVYVHVHVGISTMYIHIYITIGRFMYYV